MINKEQTLFKTLLPHIIAVAVFLIITVSYFAPHFQGKVLRQHDVSQFQGASQELREYYDKEGQTSEWTGSMFSGMPAYQIGIWGGSPNFLDYLEKPLKAVGSSDAGSIFTAMLMAYILFCMMGFKPAVSILGAVAYGFSSYNIIILDAGHVTKAWALAYMPLIVAGLMAVFRKKIVIGGILFALGLALQIKSNHLQMTYYTGLLCIILFVAYTIETLLKKDFKTFLKASGVLTIALILAVAGNAGNIFANLEMARESTRGKSELTINKTEADAKTDGLSWDYVFGWSYGKAETFTFIIPNLYGGASKPFDTDSKSIKILSQKVQSGEVPPEFANQVAQVIRQYWGNQPSTSGPVYIGVIVCFLFLLGMIIIRSRFKWALLAATLFFILLAWGKNLEGFNNWFFDHFPLYTKFRAVSSALVIPALSMVMVAAWGVKEFFSGKVDKKKLTGALYISAGTIGFICLVMWIAPGVATNFISDSDAQWKSQVPEWYYKAVLADRKDLLTGDALRSLVFVLLAGGILLFSLRSKVEMRKLAMYSTAGIAILILADLWTIDRRFVNEENYASKSAYSAEAFPKSVADNAILQDKQLSYRVLNMNNPFGETNTSYYHKSIGGYHAAKLKRYQELIENRLDEEIDIVAGSFNSQNIDSIMASFEKTPSLNMLNTKYVIYNPEQPPLVNPYAYGNGWFVDEYELVDNADAEVTALNTLNPLKTAVVDKRFESELSGLNIVPDSMATITLTEYKPNRLTYKSKAGSEQLAVLSEIYFSDGWQAYIDGKEAPHFCADWTLRAMRVPAGEHEIVFKFEPGTYLLYRTVTTVSTALLILLLIGLIVMGIRKSKE